MKSTSTERKIGIIVPIKNEKGNIFNMLNNVTNLEFIHKIIFIDGNSCDGSQKLMQELLLEFKDDRISFLSQVNPLGKFNAIRQAASGLDVDDILIWDGDNTIPFESTAEIIKIYLETRLFCSCIVVANRLTKIRLKNSFKLLNLIGNYFFSVITWPFFGQKIPDVFSGVKIFPKVILNNPENCHVLFNLDIYGDLAIFSSAKKSKLKVISIPCVYSPRMYGKTTLNVWTVGLNMLKVVFHIARHSCHK